MTSRRPPVPRPRISRTNLGADPFAIPYITACVQADQVLQVFTHQPPPPEHSPRARSHTHTHGYLLTRAHTHSHSTHTQSPISHTLSLLKNSFTLPPQAREHTHTNWRMTIHACEHTKSHNQTFGMTNKESKPVFKRTGS